MGGSSSKNFVNTFDPNKNGVAKAFNPNTNGVAKAFQPVAKALNPTTNGVANAFQKTIPAGLAVAGGAVATSLAPVGAALLPVVNQMPIAQLVQGNVGGFVSSLQNEANVVSSTLGISSLTNAIGITQPQQETQQVGYQPYQPVNVYNPPPQGSMSGVGTSSAPGSDMGSYQPMYADNMGAPPNYFGVPLDVLIIGGALAGFYMVS